MTKILIVFCFILLGTVNAQCQSECALFAKINQAICNRQFDTAIVYGDSFLKTFPNSSFIDEIMFSNASSYYYLDKLFIAKNILENIVLKEGEIQGFNLILNNCQESIYQSGFSHCYWQIYNTDTLNLKKKSKILLADIYLKQKEYRQSLDEMKNAEKWHPTQSWCGNAQIYAKYGTALRYSLLYKNLGDIDSAILVLTPYLIPIELTTNNKISDSLYSLLRLNMSKQAILDSLDNSLLHLTIDQRNVYTEWKDEFDEETGELIKIVSTHYYGRAVTWTFLNQHYIVLITNDSENKKNEARFKLRKDKNKAKYKTDEEILQHAQLVIKNYRIYTKAKY